MTEQQELTDQEREELEDSLSDSRDELTGVGCTAGEGYAPLIARYCTRADLKAISAYFDACSKAWQAYLDPIIEACMDRQNTAGTDGEGEDSYVELDASPEGGQADTNMTPAPTTTGTAQLQIQRTLPSNMNYKQAIALRVNNIQPEDVADLTPREIRELIGRLQQHRNYAQPHRCEECNTTHTIQHGIPYREYMRRHEELRKKPADSNK